MVTPLYWHYEDPDIGLTRTLVCPFLYWSTSPRGYDTGVFPFYMHSVSAYDFSESTWVTPFFQHTHDLEGWHDQHLPVPLYLGRTNDSDRTPWWLPFFWDFASPHSRTTVAPSGVLAVLRRRRRSRSSSATPTTTSKE